MRLTAIRDALIVDGTAMGIPGSNSLGLFADDVHVWVSGQTSPLAGHHHGHAALKRLMQVQDAIWPGGTHFSGNEYWWAGNSAVIHWMGRNRTWKGECCHNSGMTVLHIDNGKISEVRVYTDTEFLAETTRGWRAIVPEETGRQLPAYQFGEVASYPDPIADHSWAFDTATRDGREICPPSVAELRDWHFALLGVEGQGPGKAVKAEKPNLEQLLNNGENMLAYQGRDIPLGARFCTWREGGFQLWLRVCRSIWPTPSYFEKTLFWFNESGMALEWFSRSHTFKDQKTRNSGCSYVKFRNGKIFENTEYTDSEFFSAVHSGWREAFGEKCRDFPNFPQKGSLAEDNAWAHF